MGKVQVISAEDFREMRINAPAPEKKALTEPQKQLQGELKKKTYHLTGKFFGLLKVYGIPVPQKELAFHPTRKWLFDFAWPDHKIALEVEGGIWTNGGHSRGKGFAKDMLKYNQAGLLGWTVLRCTPDNLCSGENIDMLKTILINKPKTDERK